MQSMSSVKFAEFKKMSPKLRGQYVLEAAHLTMMVALARRKVCGWFNGRTDTTTSFCWELTKPLPPTTQILTVPRLPTPGYQGTDEVQTAADSFLSSCVVGLRWGPKEWVEPSPQRGILVSPAQTTAILHVALWVSAFSCISDCKKQLDLPETLTPTVTIPCPLCTE